MTRANTRNTAPLVLVVDDHAATRELYSTYLRTQGLRVLVASNGAIGVRMAVASRPDVIVMDLSMPMLDGWAAIRAMKRHSTGAQRAFRSSPVPGTSRAAVEKRPSTRAATPTS